MCKYKEFYIRFLYEIRQKDIDLIFRGEREAIVIGRCRYEVIEKVKREITREYRWNWPFWDSYTILDIKETKKLVEQPFGIPDVVFKGV